MAIDCSDAIGIFYNGKPLMLNPFPISHNDILIALKKYAGRFTWVHNFLLASHGLRQTI